MLLSVTEPNDPLLVPLPVRENTTVAPPPVSVSPFESFACSITVTLAPDATVLLESEMVDWEAEIDPACTVTVGNVDEIDTPLIVAVTLFAVPTAVPVNVAWYAPFPAYEVALNVPLLVPLPVTANATVRPDVFIFAPETSFTCKVTCVVPFLAMDDVVTEMDECEREYAGIVFCKIAS